MIIDCHTHVGEFWNDAPQTPVTLENLIERLDDEGIDKAVLLPTSLSSEAQFAGSLLAGAKNEFEQVAEATAFSDRIIPFGNLDPRWCGNRSNADFSLLIEKFIEMGCVGIGEMVAHLEFDDPRTVNVFRQCGGYDLPVLFHGIGRGEGQYGLIDDVGSPRLAALLEQAPDTIIIGHGQGFWAEIADGITPKDKLGRPRGRIAAEGSVPRLLRRFPNLYCDISAGSGYNALTRDPEFGVGFINEFQDRLMFGTDVCFGDKKSRKKQLTYLRTLLGEGKISHDVFDKITSGNLLGVLKLYKSGG